MGVDCSVTLPDKVRLRDVAKVIGLLLGKPGRMESLRDNSGYYLVVDDIKTQGTSMPECAEIIITGALSGLSGEVRDNRRFLYHFEYSHDSRGGHDAKCGRGIQPSCTALNIAMCVELAKFFGGVVDFNDCDGSNRDFHSPVKKDIRANDGEEWEKFQRRMAAVKPMSQAHIDRYTEHAAYK